MDKVYTQAELDALLEKQRAEVSASAAARYKDQTATIEQLNKTLADQQTKTDDLTKQLTTAQEEVFNAKEVPALKETFTKMGGNETFFNDFMALHGGKFKEEGANKDEVFKKLHTEHGHYFQNQTPTPEQVQAAKIAGEPIGGGKPAGEGTPDFTGKRNPY